MTFDLNQPETRGSLTETYYYIKIQYFSWRIHNILLNELYNDMYTLTQTGDIVYV